MKHCITVSNKVECNDVKKYKKREAHKSKVVPAKPS